MLNILFYTSFNSRSRDTESLMQAFVQQGHRVFMLSQMENGPYHEHCEKIGVRTFSYAPAKGNAIFYFLKHALFLKRFCKTHKIEVVYAHLENAGLPAVLCQYFISAKVFTCRHTVDEAKIMGSKRYLLQIKIVYALSKNIIVVSNRSKQWMIEKEGVSEKKIRVIHLAYNFELYPLVDQKVVGEIKQQYGAQLLLLTVCRMIDGKRPQLAVNICKKLVDEGLDVKLILLGDGPLLNTVKNQIKTLALESRAFALGHRPNVLDFLTASELLLHTSLLDSSSVIIKESGLCSKTVIACSDIGDVNEYLVHGKNAFLVNPENSEHEMLELLRTIYKDPTGLSVLAQNLKTAVIERFHVSNLIKEYDYMHAELEQHGKN